jgi:hypothetical protein
MSVVCPPIQRTFRPQPDHAGAGLPAGGSVHRCRAAHVRRLPPARRSCRAGAQLPACGPSPHRGRSGCGSSGRSGSRAAVRSGRCECPRVAAPAAAAGRCASSRVSAMAARIASARQVGTMDRHRLADRGHHHRAVTFPGPAGLFPLQRIPDLRLAGVAPATRQWSGPARPFRWPARPAGRAAPDPARRRAGAAGGRRHRAVRRAGSDRPAAAHPRGRARPWRAGAHSPQQQWPADRNPRGGLRMPGTCRHRGRSRGGADGLVHQHRVLGQLGVAFQRVLSTSSWLGVRTCQAAICCWNISAQEPSR